MRRNWCHFYWLQLIRAPTSRSGVILPTFSWLCLVFLSGKFHIEIALKYKSLKTKRLGDWTFFLKRKILKKKIYAKNMRVNVLVWEKTHLTNWIANVKPQWLARALKVGASWLQRQLIWIKVFIALKYQVRLTFIAVKLSKPLLRSLRVQTLTETLFNMITLLF